MRRRPLNKSNKIDVIPFLKVNDNLGNFTTTNGMRKWQLTSVSYSLLCLWDCKKWQFLEMCYKFAGSPWQWLRSLQASVVNSYKLEPQITKPLHLRGEYYWTFGWLRLTQWTETNRWWSATDLSISPSPWMESGWRGGVNETVAREWCTTLRAHKAGHQLTSETRGNRQGLYNHLRI